ncbi:MAG: TonB-dependent receptor plug domain-containing protein, partial [Rubrivivax sp.]|nr:TonB-dependent receptor plug domain-containing protein [Rubrivivax sp.]
MNPARTRLFGAILSAIAGGAFAQPSAQPAAGASQRIEVTGSMIKRIDSETTAPVSVISRDDIERSGATSIDELLRMSSLSGAGSLNDMDVGSGFAAGTASISLRGMGSAATLTLINGRRLTPAAVVDPNTGQSTIFNINTIPTSAIERIEILKAGASSLYGSDAIAGVVNIILRKDRQDRMLSLSAQQRPADGLFKTQTFGAAWGFGDLDKDRYNVSANLEVYKRDAVRITEAPDLVQQDLFGPLFARLGNNTSTTSYPGNLYSVNQTTLAAAFRGMLPGCNPDNQLPSATGSANNSCRNDADRFVEYVGKQDRVGASLRGTWNLSAQTTVNAELLASKVESTFLAAPPSRTEAPVFYG